MNTKYNDGEDLLDFPGEFPKPLHRECNDDLESRERI
jgi:hypothetical protein